MSESYQAIYEATRSRINNGNVGEAVENAIRNADISHHAHMASVAIQQAAASYESPAVLYRPRVFMDGDKWCALYGENLQDGCGGFGDSVADAMADFDTNWAKPRKTKGEA